MSSEWSRRAWLKTMAGAVVGSQVPRTLHAAGAPRPLRGALIILNTPFTASGEVDWEDLDREVTFVERGGCRGVVWPQGSSSVATLTREERLRGMQRLATIVKGKQVALVLGVQGRDTSDMLEFARRADALGTDAMIAMPPTTGRSLDDYRTYFRALGAATRTPVIVQTSGGARDLSPSVELMVELARDFPHMAYVKEESQPLLPRMRAELAARPAMKGIFGASFGTGWLYEMRLGLDGVITGNGMYADLFARMWDLHERGQHEQVRDAFSRFLLMRNLNEAIPGTDLYVMKKRGIFKTTVRRTTAPTATTAATLTEFTPSAVEREEIEFRFAALKPYLTL